MKPHQQSHLLSSYLTMEEYIGDLEKVAVQGRSPSGSGPPLTPLPPEQWAALEEPLRALLDSARAALEELAPEALRRQEQVAGPARTRQWVQVLLGRLEEVIDDLEPDRLGRKYGDLPPEEAARLRAHQQRMKKGVGQARRMLGKALTPPGQEQPAGITCPFVLPE